MAINTYWFDAQIRDYILQFCGIFGGIQVRTGKDGTGDLTFMQVPITVGNRDRVVAAIAARHTQNVPFSLPMMSAYMQSIELAPERRKGVGTVDRRRYLPQGGLFPDDMKVVYRAMPVPYNLGMELSIYASNTDQLHQILEQLMIIFDPFLQIQKNDKEFDWTRLTSVELTGISNEENYPVSQDKRMIQWSLSFTLPIYISAPLDLKDNIVKEIVVRLGNLDGFVLQEFDQNGDLQPFTEVWSTTRHNGN
jgi:hypothetical protein